MKLENNKSTKSRLVALLLVLFTGTLGIHRIYVGKVGSGVAMLLLTIFVVGIPVTAVWALIDLIVIISGQFKDNEDKFVLEWN
jgi:TM2 domain-containing membrane protein YozV